MRKFRRLHPLDNPRLGFKRAMDKDDNYDESRGVTVPTTRQTKIINLYGAPSSGKSTTASGLFYEMKRRGMSVELASEYAKELVWNRQFEDLSNQYYVTAVQHNRLWRLRGKVDYVITDSPIMLGSVYATQNQYDFPEFHAVLRKLYEMYDNVDVYINHTPDYNPEGRKETYKQAMELDGKIQAMLVELNPSAFGVSRETAVESILEHLEVKTHETLPEPEQNELPFEFRQSVEPLS